MASHESEALANLYRNWSARIAADPAMHMDAFRAMFEEWANVTAEAVGVTYEEARVANVPVLWARPSERQPGKLLICFHGGGYVTGSRASHRKLFGHIAAAAAIDALIVEYRRAPESPYPAAVEDAIAVYRWALASGIGAGRIALVGDSAGGGLAVATTLAARRDGLPTAGAMLLMSPWLDLEAKGASYDTNASLDMIVNRAIIQNLVPALLGPDGSVGDPIANPIIADLFGLPPILIQVGGHEAFLDDSRLFAARAEEAGVDVQLEIVPEMQHVFQFLAGTAAEANSAINGAGAWLMDKLTN